MYGRNLKAYRNTSVCAEISVSDPYNITKMLFQGLFERLAQAKGDIARGDLAAKARRLAAASAITENLRTTLDFSQNNSLAQSLYDLYSFILDRIANASVELSAAPIDEALRVLNPLKQAWDQIPASERQKANEMRKNNDIGIMDTTHSQSLAHGRI